VNKNRSSSTIPNFLHLDNNRCSGKKQIANLFSNYFSSVYKPPFSTPIPDSTFLNFSLPSNVSITMSDIEIELDKLTTSSNAGPDGLPGFFLARIKSFITFPIWLIFRRSLNEGIFPDLWKLTSVTPIHKAGDKDNIRNYRPISILSHLAKIFELLVVRNIQPAVNSILINQQYGFRPNRSSICNSIVFNNYILNAIENNSQVDVIFTDISKAFDEVDHSILIDLLYKSGFGEPLLSWFKSYLTSRMQWIKILDCRSEITHNTSGVPQGGHISPLLFALFMNGVSNALHHCHFLVFADDIKLFMRVDSEADCLCLQNELNNLLNWLNTIGLSLNVSKCQSMSFTRRRAHLSFTYSICGTPLERVSLKKDLGIIFTTNLDFHPHIEHICCKAFKTLGFIKRISSDFKFPCSLKSLFCSLVRSIVEFGSVLWDPYTATSSTQLERVQRKFLNYVSYSFKIDHPPHDYLPVLQYLKLNSLADRRVNANLSFLYKLLNNSIDAPDLLSEVNFRVPNLHSRSPAPFYVPFHHTNYGRNQPIHRMMRLANAFQT
jgi:hypothetical protein